MRKQTDEEREHSNALAAAKLQLHHDLAERLNLGLDPLTQEDHDREERQKQAWNEAYLESLDHLEDPPTVVYRQQVTVENGKRVVNRERIDLADHPCPICGKTPDSTMWDGADGVIYCSKDCQGLAECNE